MGGLSPTHWLIAALVFVLLFGAKKLPEMARSLGQSARVFKTEIKGMQADDEARAQQTNQGPAQQAPVQQEALPAAQAQTTQAEPQAAEGSSSSDNPR
jgi:sec-independent protein translocase protein TatA